MPHTALSESLYYLASELYVYIELCKHILPGVIHGDIVQSVEVFFDHSLHCELLKHTPV